MIANPAYKKAVAITTSGTTNFVNQGSSSGVLCSAVWVGGAGVMAAVFEDDSVVNFTCAAGTLVPIQIKRVNVTNTTATLMVALYAI